MKQNAIILVCVAIFGTSHLTADHNGAHIMQAVYEQGRTHFNQQSDVELVIQDAKQRKRIRHFKLLYKVMSGESRSLIRFYRPTTVKGTGLLSVINDAAGVETKQWLYFPSFRSVSQLNTENRHESFMGSDFTNADIAGRKPSEDTHQIMTKKDGTTIVQSIPHNKKDPYSRIVSHIIDKIKVAKRIEFYDQDGQPLKTLYAKKIKKYDGMYVVIHAVMVNHRTKGSTKVRKQTVDVQNKINAQKLSTLALKTR